MPVELTVRHVRWALSIARSTPHPDPAMCESDALLGLLRASRSFDPTVGTFGGYARRKIEWAIQDGLRDRADHLSRHHRRMVKAGLAADPGEPVSIETPVRDGSRSSHAEPFVLADVLPSADLHVDRDVQITVQDALASLDSRAGAVVRMKYHDWAWQDIADLLGVGETRVCQLYRQGLRELRAALGIDTAEELLAA